MNPTDHHQRCAYKTACPTVCAQIDHWASVKHGASNPSRMLQTCSLSPADGLQKKCFLDGALCVQMTPLAPDPCNNSSRNSPGLLLHVGTHCSTARKPTHHSSILRNALEASSTAHDVSSSNPVEKVRGCIRQRNVLFRSTPVLLCVFQSKQL